MKRIPILLLICFSAVLAAADLTGKWALVAQSPGGPQLKMELNLVREGNQLSGTMSAAGNTVAVQDVTLTGNELSFKLPIGAAVFDIKVTVEGESMKGTFTGPQGMAGTVTASRPQASPPEPPPIETKIELGEINGVSFRIDTPANFNGGLVVYCHGYGGNFKYNTKPLAPQLSVFAEAGFRIAQSSYSGGGWAIKEGIADTAALVRYYIQKYGKPKKTIITGHSMGGILTLALVEKFPDLFDAALPICGPLDVSLNFIQKRAFDLLVIFDYYYPGFIGSPVNLAPSVRMDKEYVAEMQKVMDADAKKKAALRQYAGFATEQELPLGVAFFANVVKELLARCGGNPFDNRNTVYFGGPDDVAVNRGVKRYGSDPKAVEYLKTYYTPVGKPVRPILAIHNVYDPIVPAWTTDNYGELIRLNGADKLFVQRWSPHGGHCNVKPEQHRHALEDLLRWQETGIRPDPGEQK